MVKPMPSLDCDRFRVNLSDSSSSCLETVRENLRAFGVCTFRGLEERSDFVAFINQLGVSVKHALTDDCGIQLVSPNPDKEKKTGSNRGAHGRDYLHMHTDGKGVDRCELSSGEERVGPADVLVLQILENSDPASGIPMFCDGRKLFQLIQSEDPVLAAYLQSRDAILNYTTLPHYSYSGPLFVRDRDGVSLRFDVDGNAHWPTGYLARFQSFIKRLSFHVSLESGEGYILDNRRMLHGRSAINPGASRSFRHTLIYSQPDTGLPCYSLPS